MVERFSEADQQPRTHEQVGRVEQIGDVQRPASAGESVRRPHGRSTVIAFDLAVALRSPAPLSIPFALDRIEDHLTQAL
ncbi:MAG: hypothetical protein ACRD0G_06170 [Acidimicrobiales bacterium]